MSIFGQVVGAIVGASIGRTASRTAYPVSTRPTVSEAWFRLPSDNSSKRHSIRFSDRTGPACELVSARKAERAHRTLQNYQCETDEQGDEPAAEWFGAGASDADVAYAALMDAERWPAFRIPFGGGHTVMVVVRNFPEDWGIEYFITHPGWGRHGYLATIDGHQAGPGLSWQELTYIASTPDQAAAGILDPHARLLLLLPALGDKDTPDDAAGEIGAALIQAGAPSTKAPSVATRLLDHPMWEPAHWSMPSTSNEQPYVGILQCDGPGSPRFGMRLAQGISQAQSIELARALGTANMH